jgi:hypothetical protein
VTSRERVRRTLSFQEPDRVPLDLGGTSVSGISAHALDRLRKHLGLPQKRVKVYEMFQILGEVEMDLVEMLDVDVLPIDPVVQYYGLRRKNYKPWQFWDGTEFQVPENFEPEADAEGNLWLHTDGDLSKPREGVMPKNGMYFDAPALGEIHDDFTPPSLEEAAKSSLGILTAEDLEVMQARVEHLRKHTDKALALNAWHKIGLSWVGSFPDFLVLMLTDKNYVKDLFAMRTEHALRNLARMKSAFGDSVDIVCIDGQDYGSQRSETFSPDLFAELYLPYFKMQNDWIHANTNWKVFQHTCGSVPHIIPMLIEAGVDILNPVQITATGMDAESLKRQFGGKIVFWGGGVETQHTLPFSSPEEVARHVEENIRTFAPGGGFVFSAVHNIPHGTKPENIVAAFRTAHSAGRYPIRST